MYGMAGRDGREHDWGMQRHAVKMTNLRRSSVDKGMKRNNSGNQQE